MMTHWTAGVTALLSCNKRQKPLAIFLQGTTQGNTYQSYTLGWDLYGYSFSIKLVKNRTWWHTAKKILWNRSASYSPREMKGSGFLSIQTRVVFSRTIRWSRLFRQLLIIDQSPGCGICKEKPPDSVFLLLKTPTDRNVFSSEAIIALKKIISTSVKKTRLVALLFTIPYLPNCLH